MAAPFLLHTKLYRPRLTADLVIRERLLALFGSDHRPPLTLVSAPAGYGKTTLVSHWLETLDTPSAWLSLDESDGDLRLFLSYVVAAVRGLFSDACHQFSSLLDDEHLLPHRHLAGALANDLDKIDTPLVLAFDDYHRIRNPAIHEFVDCLLSHPPRNLQLVILTRHDPPLSLTSLRARGWLTEIRMADLRFDAAETAVFLGQTVEGPQVDGAAANLLETTEGWPVVLRLAILALRHSGGAALFSASHGGNSLQVQNYLVAEVLAHLSPDVRDWLCRTSILERFCAPLCEAVNGPSTEADTAEDTRLDGPSFLEILESQGMPCLALDPGREWYRYHHLFQELLHQHLEAAIGRDEISTLHRRAAGWFEEHDLIEEALHHALAAGDPRVAAGMVSRSRHRLMNDEQLFRLRRCVARLPRGTIDSDPGLLLTEAWTMIGFPEMSAILNRVEKLLSSDAEATNLHVELDLLRGIDEYDRGLGEDALRSVERVLDQLPPTMSTARAYAVLIAAMASQMTGNTQRAHDIVLEELSNLAVRRTSFQTYMLATLCYLQWNEANLSELAQTADQFLRLGLELELPESTQHGRYFLGILHYQRNDVAAAEKILAAVVENRRIVTLHNYLHCAFALALTYEAQGRSGRADEVIRRLADLAHDGGRNSLLQELQAFRAELAMRRGRLAEASQWAESVRPKPLRGEGYKFYLPQLTQARIWLVRGTDADRQRAAALLTPWHKRARATHNTLLLIQILAMESLASPQDKEDEALDSLKEAILLAQAGRVIRVFVDLGPRLAGLLHRLELEGDTLRYVGEILAAFGAIRHSRPAAAEPQLLTEPLTRRELEILGFLAERLSNREIADRLFISPVTVKRHTSNIYGKLSVHDRRQAVTKAAGLGLLTSV